MHKSPNLTGKVQHRTVAITREAIDIEARTVDIAFASETPVDRWWYTEVLSLDPQSIRLGRMQNGAPLLKNHDTAYQIGVVDSAVIDKDKVGRATVRFSKNKEAQEIFQDVIDNIRRHISVGYLVHKTVEEKGGASPVVRVVDWEPLEVSFVPIPADDTVGVGRNLQEKTMPREERMKAGDVYGVTLAVSGDMTVDSVPDGEEEDLLEEDPMKEMAAEGVDGEEPQRSTKNNLGNATLILNLARQLNWPSIMPLARQYALEDRPLSEFRKAASAILHKQTQQQRLVTPPPIATTAWPQIDFNHYRPRYFKGATNAEAAEKAYRFGQFFLATMGRAKAQRFCRTNGIPIIRGQKESENDLGGYVVPIEFETSLIDLRDKYGVFRQHAQQMVMGSNTKQFSIDDDELEAEFVGEEQTTTEQEETLRNALLVAKKIKITTGVSDDLDEDSLVNMGDLLMNRIAQAFARKEDNCGFNGDGTSPFGGIVGVIPKFLSLDATIANIAGLVVASGSGYASNYNSITLTDFENVVGLLPQYADEAKPQWFVHRSFWATVMRRELLELGGATVSDGTGAAVKEYLGYPVVFSQVLPKVSAVSQIVAIFGDLSLAAVFGDRRGTEIKTSEHADFDNDRIKIKGTQRFDINIHSVGNAHATASSRKPGPIVALITAAS